MPFTKFLFLLLFLPLMISRQMYAADWKLTLLDSFPKSPEDSEFTISKAAAIDLDFQGNVYILDHGRHQLLKFSPDGRLIKQIGGFGNAEESFDDPRDVFARTPLDVFIADYNNARVIRFDKNLNFLSELTSAFQPPFNFERVLSVAVSSQYDLFLLEESQNRVIKFSRFSEPTVAFGGFDDPYGQLLEPTDLALDGNNRLFVADPGQPAIVVFDYLGNYLTHIKHPDFQDPAAVFWSADEKLYVADRRRRKIFVFVKGIKFYGVINLANQVPELVGIASQAGAVSKPGLFYVLSANRCYKFEIAEKQTEK